MFQLLPGRHDGPGALLAVPLSQSVRINPSDGERHCIASRARRPHILAFRYHFPWVSAARRPAGRAGCCDGAMCAV